MDRLRAAPIEQCSDADAGEHARPETGRVELAAFGEIYKQHLPRILGYLRARSRSEEDAADLAEQVFEKALEALPRYEDWGLPLAAWLFRIAHNVAADASRRHRWTVPWDRLPEALHPVDDADPELASLRREERERVRAVLAALNEGQREIVVLRFVGGLSVREIADVVGKGESAVYKQLTRALRTIKERYDEAES